MLPPDTLSEIEGYWLANLGCPPPSLFDKDVVVLPHSAFKGYQGLFLVRRGRSCMISTPVELIDLVHTLTNERDPAEVYGTGLWRDQLPDFIESVVGPGWVGYCDASVFRPDPLPGVIPLTPDEFDALAGLRTAVGETDWMHSGLSSAHPYVAGLWDGGNLIGAVGYEVWGERIAQIGVAVDPAWRGEGRGLALVSAAAQQAIEAGLIAQFRFMMTNQPAMSIARKLGFELYAETLAIGMNTPLYKRYTEAEEDRTPDRHCDCDGDCDCDGGCDCGHDHSWDEEDED